MSIYTKFGDKGKTSLYGGKTVSKSDVRVEAYGSCDELNSFLGVILNGLKDKKIRKEIIQIQKDLFEIGSSLASLSKNKDADFSLYLKKRTKDFENQIDVITNQLPQLENFILPGGGKTGSKMHFARTLVRKTERRIVALSQEQKINKDILIFINRLSDLLFMYARHVNKKENKKEILWGNRK